MPTSAKFINLIIDELTRMDRSRLFESPYIDLAPTGNQTLFWGELAKDEQPRYRGLGQLRRSGDSR